MIVYLYKKKEKVNVLKYENFPSDEAWSCGYLNSEMIVSTGAPFTVGTKSYIRGLDGFYYLENDGKKSNFTETPCIDNYVVPQCKVGLGVFDRPSGTDEILHLNALDHVLFRLNFINSDNGDMWAGVSIIDEDGNLVVEKGYIVYKNRSNNYVNTRISDSKIPTFLTSGVLDQSKIKYVLEEQKNPIMTLGIDTYDGATDSDKYSELETRKNKVTSADKYTELKTRTFEKTNGDDYSELKTHTFDLKMKSPYENDEGKRRQVKGTGTIRSTYVQRISKHHPTIVQNSKKFPKYKKVGGEYVYDYSMNYELEGSLMNFKPLRKHENLDIRNINANYLKNVTMYNRFKIANAEDILSKGFLHIFFTRPDLNIMKGEKLSDQCKNNPIMLNVFDRKPELIKELVLSNGSTHDYLMLLSNKATNFTPSDEAIDTDSYGRSVSGYSIKFGRRKDSELGGSFDINFSETRDLDIINLHKIWIEYIVNVYRGVWSPQMKYIQKRILDYASSCYVILTAEDGETILYWSKYYGVFPVNVPFSALSWNAGTLISKPDLSITYNYSWKEEFNPLGLTEMNINTFRTKHPTTANYEPTYNKSVGHIGYTWVGAPFVETIKYTGNNVDLTNGSKYALKLRFQSK